MAKLNRKGDIALTLVLVLTFVLFLTGLYAFVTDNRNFGDESKQIALMYGTLNFGENYINSEAALIANQTLLSGAGDSNLKEKYMEIAKTHKLGIESEGTFFTQIEHGDFKFENVSNEYVFEIKDVTIISKYGVNQVIRNFNINLKLDKSST